MASKPLIALARWADLVGSFVTDPSSGERDTGFEDGNPAEADKVNALLKQLYLWALYLDGAVLSGSHAIDGSFTVGGQPLVFADFTYTADAGTDTLTKTAHGLETGDGQVRTTNSGGGLPGGLAAGTDYFAIKTGANTFKLATTRALALAGIAIDITSAGTGTHTLIDQAGTTRVADATVTRDLFVDGTVTAPRATVAQATIESLAHGDMVLNIPGLAVVAGTSITIVAGGAARAGAAVIMRWAIPLHLGDRIKSLTFARIGNVSADILAADVFKATSTGGFGTINTGGTTVTVPNVPASWADTTINVDDTELAAGEVLYLEIETDQSGIDIHNIRVTYDRPP
jgi:hypothetical protein